MIKRLFLLVVATGALVFGCLIVSQGQAHGDEAEIGARAVH